MGISVPQKGDKGLKGYKRDKGTFPKNRYPLCPFPNIHYSSPMSHRPALLATTVRELIAPVLRMAPRECGIISITRVDVSADLSYATVYITALHNTKLAMEYLEKQKKEFQKNLGQLQSHRTPKLRFRIDESIEQATRIGSARRAKSQSNRARYKKMVD
jgi:ribosome-binding factor A